MGGFNLPPGCSVNDLPGNSPEEGRWEAMIENFFDKLDKKYQEIIDTDDVQDIVIKAIQYGIEIGIEQQKDNEGEIKYFDELVEEEKECDRMYYYCNVTT